MANYTVHTFKHNLDKTQGCCAAIGFFDGVHRGHQYLIDQVKAEAKKRGLSPILISFEEHPRLALSGARYWPELLTTNPQVATHGANRARCLCVPTLRPRHVHAYLARVHGVGA